jgi:hypothetical protein
MPVTQEQIINTLSRLKNTSFASISTITKPKLSGGKKNPQQGKITKIAENCHVFMYCNIKTNSYENAVRKQLEKSGIDPDMFKLGKRAWGERIPGTPFIKHKDKIYLEVIFVNPPKNVRYLHNDKPIDKDDIIGLSKPKKQNDDKVKEARNKVTIRTFDLNNITAIKMGQLSVL